MAFSQHTKPRNTVRTCRCERPCLKKRPIFGTKLCKIAVCNYRSGNQLHGQSQKPVTRIKGTHLRRDTFIPQRFQASKAAAASDGHAVHF
jgi:hypothetical protein